VSYVVWIQSSNYDGGYHPSDPLDTLAECFEHIIDQTYGNQKYMITTPVEVDFVDKSTPPFITFPPGVRGLDLTEGGTR
jgi:hypothetical protein